MLTHPTCSLFWWCQPATTNHHNHRADADLTLVSLPDPPENAYAHRVVWITGASQVRMD